MTGHLFRHRLPRRVANDNDLAAGKKAQLRRLMDEVLDILYSPAERRAQKRSRALLRVRVVQ